MPDSTIDELRERFESMQTEIDATRKSLNKLKSDTIIVREHLSRCAPILPPEPPRYIEDCEIKGTKVSIGDFVDAIDKLSKWNQDMIRVLDEAAG